MQSRTARIISIVIGIIAILVGLLWIGQGSNVIHGSGMSGNRTWFWIGLVIAIIGVILLLLGLRRSRRTAGPQRSR
jgi:hypothetical protein